MIDFMAMDPDAVVEPWNPKVGDRVRVRLSPECDAKFRREGSTGPFSFDHDSREDGLEGVVLEVDPSAQHEYYVGFDRPYFLGLMRVVGREFAACELEPLS